MHCMDIHLTRQSYFFYPWVPSASKIYGKQGFDTRKPLWEKHAWMKRCHVDVAVCVYPGIHPEITVTIFPDIR